MKRPLKIIGLSGLFVMLFFMRSFSQSESPYSIGQTINNFSIFDFASKKYSTKDVEKNTIVLFFIGNHCPSTDIIVAEMKDLYVKYHSSVEFWAINSNNPNYSPEDSEEKMKEYYDRYKLPYPYLVDLGQVVAANFNIKQTPMAVILQRDGDTFKFVYRGIIIEKNGVSVHNYIDKNLLNLQRGKPVINSTVKQKLCEIL